MIHIYKSDGRLIRSFKNDNAFNHLSAGELLEDHPEVEVTHWSFVVFPPQRVPDLYFNMRKEFLVPPIKEAYEQQVRVIEICNGDFATPTWVPVTAGLNIGRLKKDWYFAYCRKHGYAITENDNAPSGTTSAEVKEEKGR